MKTVFLDRDGVINKRPASHDYVKSWKEFELLPGVLRAMEYVENKGYKIIVISNQRGVARGMVSVEVVERIHSNLNKLTGKKILAFYYCPHHGDEPECNCRKPKPGLVERAVEDWGVHLEESVFIGDSDSDTGCAAAAGVKFVKLETNGNLYELVTKHL